LCHARIEKREGVGTNREGRGSETEKGEGPYRGQNFSPLRAWPHKRPLPIGDINLHVIKEGETGPEKGEGGPGNSQVERRPGFSLLKRNHRKEGQSGPPGRTYATIILLSLHSEEVGKRKIGGSSTYSWKRGRGRRPCVSSAKEEEGPRGEKSLNSFI